MVRCGKNVGTAVVPFHNLELIFADSHARTSYTNLIVALLNCSLYNSDTFSEKGFHPRGIEFQLPLVCRFKQMQKSDITVELKSPVEGTIVEHGQQLVVEATSSEDVRLMMLSFGFDFIDMKSKPYVHSFTVPDDIVGPIAVSASVFDEHGLSASETVHIQVKSPEAPVALLGGGQNPEMPVILCVGEVHQLLVKGIYEDGKTRAINFSVCGTTYTNSTPDIISVDSNGLVKALNPGKAEVRATNSGLSVNLLVYVIEDYLPPSIEGEPVEGELVENPVKVEDAAESLLDQFNNADTNDDGLLSYEESLSVTASLTQEQFDELDIDNDGFLSQQELETFLEDTRGCCDSSDKTLTPQELFERTLGDWLIIGVSFAALSVLTLSAQE